MNPETVLYLNDCVNEVFLRGEIKFDADNVHYLIDAVNQITWKDVERSLPEALPKYQGRSRIPCLVVVGVCKPRVTICQRRWDNDRCRWVWSRGLNVTHWREVPKVW